MVQLPTQLNENTRLALRFNNVWAIAISIVTTSFIVGMFYSGLVARIDMVIANQNELKQDFKVWKSQAETRLGQAEIDINTIWEKQLVVFRFLKL